MTTALLNRGLAQINATQRKARVAANSTNGFIDWKISAVVGQTRYFYVGRVLRRPRYKDGDGNGDPNCPRKGNNDTSPQLKQGGWLQINSSRNAKAPVESQQSRFVTEDLGVVGPA